MCSRRNGGTFDQSYDSVRLFQFGADGLEVVTRIHPRNSRVRVICGPWPGGHAMGAAAGRNTWTRFAISVSACLDGARRTSPIRKIWPFSISACRQAIRVPTRAIDGGMTRRSSQHVEHRLDRRIDRSHDAHDFFSHANATTTNSKSSQHPQSPLRFGMPETPRPSSATKRRHSAGPTGRYEFQHAKRYAVDLSGVTGRAPRVCMVPTAQGDNCGRAAQPLRRRPGPLGSPLPTLRCSRCRTSTTSKRYCSAYRRDRSAGTWAAPPTRSGRTFDLSPTDSPSSPSRTVCITTPNRSDGPFSSASSLTAPCPPVTPPTTAPVSFIVAPSSVEAVSECDGAAAYFVDSDWARAVERRLDTRRL